jgi:adenylylsulfate kinase
VSDLPAVTRSDRSRLLGHAPIVLWFTGLSGSGKSTLASALEVRLHQDFHALTYLLDGDVVRTGLNRDLDFSAVGRKENIRRIGEVAHLFYDAGLIVLTTFISPFRADRDAVRAMLPAGGFVEIYVSCPLEVCESRDVKGLYRKARAGLIPDFTGIGSPYEPPANPELTLDSASRSHDDCVEDLVRFLVQCGVVKDPKGLGDL